MEEVFKGYRVTAHCRGGEQFVHMMHNARIPAVVSGEDHIDQDGYNKVLVDCGSVQKAFKILFSKPIAEYNKGKKPSRQIKDYYKQICDDLRKGKHKNQKADGQRKTAYEFTFYIGNRESHPDNELVEKILTDFMTKYLPKKYPNIFHIQQPLHGDEFSLSEDKKEKIYSPVHAHDDFIYIAHALTPEEAKIEKERRAKIKLDLLEKLAKAGEKWDEKKWKSRNWQKEMVGLYGKSLMSGPSLQCSMSAALAEMGFFTEKGKGTAQQQFEEQVRADLQDFAESYGIKIDRSKGRKHSHVEKEVYQQQQENERKKIELTEREEHLDELEVPVKKRETDIAQKEKEVHIKEVEIQQREISVISKENELSRREKSVDKLNKDVSEKKKFLESFTEVENDIKAQCFALDSAEKDFCKNNVPLSSRVKLFLTTCKKIVTSALVELDKYKKAFKQFWRASPEFFRELASKMEKNNCADFRSYEVKRRSGKLIKEKSQSQITITGLFEH